MVGGRSMMWQPRRLGRAVAVLSVLGLAASSSAALAGSARDYLNAPIDSWLTFYNLED
jgi:hypothetical protein